MAPPTLLQKGHVVSDDPNIKNMIPIDYITDWFKLRQSLTGISNRVLILNAATGAGKTTVLPPHLYDILPFKIIAVAQPRIITAVENAKEIANAGFYPQMKLGENIGYQTGPEKYRPSSRKSVLFVTVGVLTMHFKMFSDIELINKYSAIIIDEIHETSVELAELLLKIKEFLMRNKDHPQLPFVVCMSATLVVQKYLDYFGNLEAATNFINISGHTYEIKKKWLPDNTPQGISYIELIVTHIAYILVHETADDKKNQNDILVFLPNHKAMIELKKGLDFLNDQSHPNQIIMPLMLDREAIATGNFDYFATFQPIDTLKITIKRGDITRQYEPTRRVIMATNVAETGLTIDTLKYVIDWGYHRDNEFYPTIGAYCLLNRPASQSRILQRIGRVGRKFPGEFYAMYTKKTFDRLQAQHFSNFILGENSNIVLNTLKPDVPFYPGRMDLIENLSPDSISYATEKCYALGFCDMMGRLTPLGALGAKFVNMRLEVIRMIAAGYFWGVNILDLITIAAGLSMQPGALITDMRLPVDWTTIYEMCTNKIMSSGAAAIDFLKMKMIISDDFINFIFLFAAANAAGTELEEFCTKINIKFGAILSIVQSRDEIIDQMLNFNFNLFLSDVPRLTDIKNGRDFMNMVVRIKYCIYDGFRLNCARFSKKTMCYSIAAGEIMAPAFIGTDKSTAEELKNKYNIDRRCSPKIILYNKLYLKYNERTKMYRKIIDYASAMDGFVKTDNNFL